LLYLYDTDELDTTALHPYYKLAYIELAWGGTEEQEQEQAMGNSYAKNWQDEAWKLLESMVHNPCQMNSSVYGYWSFTDA
jgi:hypothetical protein